MRYATFVLLFFAIYLSSCETEDSAFKSAVNNRTKSGFTSFLEKYPDSEIRQSAELYIADIAQWDSIKASKDSLPYLLYLQQYSEGLFKAEALGNMSQIQEYGNVVKSGYWDDYNAYLSKFPSGIFAEEAKKELAVLVEAKAEFAKLMLAPSLDSLREFTLRHEKNAYGRQAWQALDSLAEIEVEKEMGVKFSSIKPESKTFEDYLVKKTLLAGVLPTSVIEGTSNLVLNGKAQRFSFKQGPGDERPVAFSDKPGDHLLIEAQTMFGTMVFSSSSGSVVMPGLQDVNCTDGTLIRFYGHFPRIKNMKFTSKGKRPLCFLLSKKMGWVHLYGEGSVIAKDGKRYDFK